MRKMLLISAAALVSAVPSAMAQSGEGSFEGKLLRMLEERGVISADEATELEGLAAEMREAESLDARIESRVDEMVATMAPTAAMVSHQEGKGLVFEEGPFKVNLGGLLQIRFTYQDEDEEEIPNFSVPRARVWLKGSIYEDFSYKVQFDVAGDEASSTVPDGMGGTTGVNSGNRLAELKDAHVDWAYNDQFKVRFGQYKAPYSRHWLTSSGKLQFVDRARTNRTFAPGRQVGVMVHGSAGDDGMFSYYAGLFNGDGENRPNNDEGLMYVGRATIDPLGAAPLTEGDHRTGSDRPLLLSFGANGWYHEDDNMVDGEDDWSVGADAAAFVEGFSGLLELHFRENGAFAGSDEEIFGVLAQAGYFVVPGEVEVVGRFSWQDYDGSSLEEISEYGIGVGYFPGMHAHNLKIQFDLTYSEECFVGGATSDFWRARIQVSLYF